MLHRVIRMSGRVLPRSTLAICAIVSVAIAAYAPAGAVAQSVDDLRITEVVPDTGQAEVTYFGTVPLTLSNTLFFCHSFTYTSTISSGTQFNPGQSRVFTVSGLNSTKTDLWLYRNDVSFDDASNIIHGLDFGGLPVSGRTSLAVTVGKWPDTSSSLPQVSSGFSLTNPSGSFNAEDWYIDANPALGTNPNPIPPIASVPSALAWPSSTETFEALDAGNPLLTLQDWVFINGGATYDFTARAAIDAPSITGMRPTGSGTWIRIQDADDGDNRFYSPDILAPGQPETYRWTWYVLFERMPTPGTTYPRMVMQHHNGAGYANAWGIEYTEDEARLIVLDYGGTPASTPIGTIDTNTWYRFDLHVSFLNDVIQASMNKEPTVSLPIDLDPIGDKTRFRFCYRGEGVTNMVRMLLDDISFEGTQANDPPTITAMRGSTPLADQETIVVSFGQSLASLNLSFDIDDPDGDPVVVAAVITDMSQATGLSITQFESDAKIGPYTLSPTSGGFSTPNVTLTFELTVDDGQGAPVVFTFFVDVEDQPNTDPTVAATVDGAVLAHDDTLSVTAGTAIADLNLAFEFDDADGDSLTVTATIGNSESIEGLEIDEFQASAATSPLTLSPSSGVFTAPNVGHTFTLTVDDGRGGSATFTFHVEVTEGEPDDGGRPKDDSGCGIHGSSLTLGWLALIALGLLAVRRRV